MATLQVDFREQEVYIDQLRYQAPSFDLEVDVGAYDVADYFIGNRLGIEHKSHGDFLNSIGSRLFTQAHELAANFEIPVVLVSSDPTELMNDRHNPEVIRGFVSSLTVREGVRVLFCGPDPVPWILKLAQKATTPTTRIYNPMRRGGSKREYGIGIVAALPNMGLKRAEKLVAHFGSPLETIASVMEWGQVPGIGNKTIEKALEVLCANAGEEDADTDREVQAEFAE